jgi:tetratricopeptide (TPR) repeat protein
MTGADPASLVPQLERVLTLLDVGDVERRSTVLFSLGVAYTKLLRFEEARDRYLQLIRDPFAPGREVTLCNLAETYMYLHDVDQSLDRYVECANALPQRATGWWGLAIAHDRAGHQYDGQLAADRALPVDPELRDIRGDGVFYVPEYERWYYEGMAFEAIARASLSMPDRRRALNHAAGCWNHYLTVAAATDPWLDRVRSHEASVRRQLAVIAAGVREAATASASGRAAQR